MIFTMFRDMAKRAVHHLLMPVLVLLLLTTCSSQPELPRLAPDATILAFGNSLTYGSGAKERESYPAVLSRLTGFDVVNAGIPGEVTSAGLARLPDLLDEVQPQMMILCHGGNDMLGKRDMNRMADNLRSMIRMARQRDVMVILIAVPQPGLLLSPPELYRRVADEMNVPVEMDVLSDVLSERSMKSDTIHPNAQGYRKIAKAIFQLMEDAGAVR